MSTLEVVAAFECRHARPPGVFERCPLQQGADGSKVVDRDVEPGRYAREDLVSLPDDLGEPSLRDPADQPSATNSSAASTCSGLPADLLGFERPAGFGHLGLLAADLQIEPTGVGLACD